MRIRHVLRCFMVAIAFQIVFTLPTDANARSVMRGAAVEVESPTSFHTLYNFPRYSGTTGLSSVNGLLFGTLDDPRVDGGDGNGYVYSATTAGAVTLLYHFTGSPDGATPDEVTAFNGVLYGLTAFGGTIGQNGGCGTFFAVPYTGGETVSSVFPCGKSATFPSGKLLRYHGAFFGETNAGGLNNYGTIFVAHDDGTTKVLYSFGGRPDGESPSGGLEELGGTLYGVTEYGGAYRHGAVFAILPTGAEKIIHSFSKMDGFAPVERLTAVDGVLYGVAQAGGAHTYGTIFAITPSGAFKVLHNFGPSPDGIFPQTSLLAFGGALIGATFYGGLHGHGLLFKVSYSGEVTRLHSFDGTDGTSPSGKLTCVGATIYGTTLYDGADSGGTLYSYKL